MGDLCRYNTDCGKGYFCDKTINMCDPCSTCLEYYDKPFCDSNCPGEISSHNLVTSDQPPAKIALQAQDLTNHSTSNGTDSTNAVVYSLIASLMVLGLVALVIVVLLRRRQKGRRRTLIKQPDEGDPLHAQAENTATGELDVPTGNPIDLATTLL